MKFLFSLYILIGCVAILCINPAFSAGKTVSGRIKGLSSGTVVAITAQGSKSDAVDSKGNFSIKLPSGASKTRLVVLSNGKLSAIAYANKCSLVKKTSKIKCQSTQLAPSFRASKLGTFTYNTTSGIALLAKPKTIESYNKTVFKDFVSSDVAATALNLGLVGSEISQRGNRLTVFANDSTDNDGDGAPDQTDADDDNDGIIDSYDSTSGTGGTDSNRFPMFSNFKVSLESSLNANTGTVTDEAIDALMRNTTTLAIGVLAGDGEKSELACNGLTYCSVGGTGQTLVSSTAFPGTSGGPNDAEGNGDGDITKGSTGDFQLRPGASSSEIQGGDTIIQRVTNIGTGVAREVTSMLNFVFSTTPSLKSVQVNSDTPITFSYPIANDSFGTSNNCIPVPSSGDVNLTLVGWRPQRKGVTGAGEAEFMDIGNSQINIDIPNAACSAGQGGGCSGQGPHCGITRYSTTDANLDIDTVAGTMTDTSSDAAASASNTFIFTFDLSGCVTEGASTWNSGEKIFLDLQMRNSVGDNAAVKFCVRRL